MPSSTESARRKKVDSIKFLEATLESLDFVEGILARPHSARDKKLYERDACLYYCYNASVIAVALAEIKLTSRCSSRLAGYGLAAIARQLYPFARDVIPSEYRPRYEQNLRDTKEVLKRFK